MSEDIYLFDYLFSASSHEPTFLIGEIDTYGGAGLQASTEIKASPGVTALPSAGEVAISAPTAHAEPPAVP